MKKIFCLLYYVFAQYLPDNYLPVIGKFSKRIRRHVAGGFNKVSKTANIQKHVYLMGGVFV